MRSGVWSVEQHPGKLPQNALSFLSSPRQLQDRRRCVFTEVKIAAWKTASSNDLRLLITSMPLLNTRTNLFFRNSRLTRSSESEDFLIVSLRSCHVGVSRKSSTMWGLA